MYDNGSVAEENACRVEHVLTEEAFEAIENYFKNK